MKEIQTYIKQLFQSGQNELQTRDVDKENKENDRPGISTCSSHVFTNPECSKVWELEKYTNFSFGHFTTTSGHFFATYIFIFYKI